MRFFQDQHKRWHIFVYPATTSPARHAPVLVEIGPGRGDFLFHLAVENPQAMIVGVEVQPKRVDKLIANIERRRLKNIFLLEADARAALPSLFGPTSLAAIYVNFPDPWPKRRHHKHRLVTDGFLAMCLQLLAEGGVFSFVTDVHDYAAAVAAEAEKFRDLQRIEGEVFPTLFAEKWRSMGRSISSQKYQKSSRNSFCKQPIQLP